MRSSIAIFVLAFAALGLLLGYSESYDVQKSGAQDMEVAVADVEERIDELIRVMQTTGVPLHETTELRSFAGLQSVENALAGQSGTTAERVDGAEMIASYAPVKAHPHTWGIVFLQPARAGAG